MCYPYIICVLPLGGGNPWQRGIQGSIDIFFPIFFLPLLSEFKIAQKTSQSHDLHLSDGNQGTKKSQPSTPPSRTDTLVFYPAPAPNGLTSLRIDSAHNLRDIYALTINAQKTFISQMWLIKMIEPPAKTVCDQNWRPSTLESPLCTHAFIFTWGLNSIDN